jgi:hypothetical protein
MFNFVKIHDPYLGKGTFGQLARFGPERCALMHLQLSQLENGGWKEKPEFKRYIDARASSTKRVQKYLDKAVNVFFKRFRVIFNRHMVAKWTSSETLHYVLGGDKYHAKQFARWLVRHHATNSVDGSESIVSDIFSSPTKSQKTPSTPPILSQSTCASTLSYVSPLSEKCTPSSIRSSGSDSEIERFKFSKRTITLGKHHNMDRENKSDITIKLRDSMEFLTEYADPSMILDDDFVKDNWTYIEALAESKRTVDLFCKTEDGKVDKTSWKGNDYAPFINDIIRRICIHSSHQQRCENYVQLCGLVAKTGVGEVRRTCRAIINSVINRRFNPWAIEQVNKRRAEKGKARVRRVQGKEKFALVHEFITGFFEKCDKGLLAAPTGLEKKVAQRLSGLATKASKREQKAKVDNFINTIGKKLKFCKAQEARGVQLTAQIEGAVFLRHLAKSNKAYLEGARYSIEDIIDDEFITRNITVDKCATIIAKKQAIRNHEWLRRLGAKEVLKETDVQYIMPLSNTMQHFLDTYYMNILNEEKVTIEASEED